LTHPTALLQGQPRPLPHGRRRLLARVCDHPAQHGRPQPAGGPAAGGGGLCCYELHADGLGWEVPIDLGACAAPPPWCL